MTKHKYGNINDMPRGWSNKNKREYYLWTNMFQRCYSKKYHRTHQTYTDCYVCDRWFLLSNFIEDLPKIKGYDYWLNHPNENISLDKDINSDNKNKCYCLEECQFVTKEKNSSQSINNRNKNGYKIPKESFEKRIKTIKEEQIFKGLNNPNLGKLIARYSVDGKLIDIKYRFQYEEMGFAGSSISSCCRKGSPKTVGNGKGKEKFIFKYYKSEEDED